MPVVLRSILHPLSHISSWRTAMRWRSLVQTLLRIDTTRINLPMLPEFRS